MRKDAQNDLYHCQGGNTSTVFMVKERTNTEKQGRTTCESQENVRDDGKQGDLFLHWGRDDPSSSKKLKEKKGCDRLVKGVGFLPQV